MPSRHADDAAFELTMSDAAGPAFAFPETVLAQEVSGELVLLDLSSEQYYGLDRVGADIITRLTQAPEGEAIASLCRDYDVTPAVLHADAERLVTELLEAGLLVRSSAR